MNHHRHRDWWACRPGTEVLEGRRLPTQFGVPWHDARHLSVSFVPDGTPVGSSRSDLFASLDAQRPATDWQREVLRAFQTWAVAAHVNFAVQPDAGLPLGTPGPDQHDPRFGDIRIGARPMSPEVLSISVPHDPFLSGTWSGDVLLNSAATYQGDRSDLFPVLLHEVGHVLGLDHSDDPASVMSSHLNNRLTRLSPGDIAAVRSLYGARPGDEYEGPAGNRDVATAAPLPTPAGYDGSTPLLIYADVTRPGEQDVFSLQAPAGYRGPATVRLQSAGVSLLAPRLTVLDASGNVVADLASVRVGGDTLQVTLPAVEPGATYHVEVRGASDDVFGVGEYALAVSFDGRSTVGADAIDRLARQSYGYLSADDIRAIFLDPSGALFHDDRHTDDTFATSAPLDPAGAYGTEAPDRITASLADPSDVDVYHVETPEPPHDGLAPPLVMTVTGRATEVNGLMPRVAVFDADRNPVPSLVLAHGDGTYTIQVAGVRPESEYFVEVRHDATSGKVVGNYELDVEYGHTAAAPTNFVTSTTGPRGEPQSYALVVNQAQLFDFLLAAGPDSGGSGSAVQMSVVDAQGRTVGERTAAAGETAGGDPWLLLPGDYTVTFTGIAPAGQASAPLAFRLYGGSLSEPIGPALDDSTLRPVAGPAVAGLGAPDVPYLWLATSLAAPRGLSGEESPVAAGHGPSQDVAALPLTGRSPADAVLTPALRTASLPQPVPFLAALSAGLPPQGPFSQGVLGASWWGARSAPGPRNGSLPSPLATLPVGLRPAAVAGSVSQPHERIRSDVAAIASSPAQPGADPPLPVVGPSWPPTVAGNVPPTAVAPEVSGGLFAPAFVVLGMSAIAYGRTRRPRGVDPASRVDFGSPAGKPPPRRFIPVVRSRREPLNR